MNFRSPPATSTRLFPGRLAAIRAFSLVEVALAVGIFSFGVLSLIGLLPVALTNHQEAKLDTILAQITQRLAAEVVLTDAERLTQLHGLRRAFDVEGRELSDVADPRAVYQARVALDTFIAPGSAAASSSLRRAVIYAVHDPAGTKINTPAAPPVGAILVARAESAPPS